MNDFGGIDPPAGLINPDYKKLPSNPRKCIECGKTHDCFIENMMTGERIEEIDKCKDCMLKNSFVEWHGTASDGRNVNMAEELNRLEKDFFMNWPKHHQMTITHNEHHTNYESVEEYLERTEHISICHEDKLECIRIGEVWEIQWYPNTPIGFYCVGSYSLEKCIEIIKNTSWEQV